MYIHGCISIWLLGCMVVQQTMNKSGAFEKEVKYIQLRTLIQLWLAKSYGIYHCRYVEVKSHLTCRHSSWMAFTVVLYNYFQIPEDFSVVYSNLEGEISVGGVYLRIFISQPTWVLRKPREFMVALLEKFTELLQSKNPNVSWFNYVHILTFFLWYISQWI